ncbi:MAG: hypothetical protein V4671_33015 [Armatimonadota bacterium]
MRLSDTIKSLHTTTTNTNTDPTDNTNPSSGAVLFLRAPGLLARTARQQAAAPDTVPVVITAGRQVRDTCPLSRSHGIESGLLVTHARRLCPWLLAIPQEDIDARRIESLARHLLLDPLADVTPTIEPAGDDSAWADLSGCPPDPARSLPSRLTEAISAELGIPPLIGIGPSRLAARALAECGLPPDRLHEADAARWLWPEDPLVSARLARLGLPTFADVAAAGEGALVHVFGAKQGRLLYCRAAGGQDFAAPIRAVYPPPVVTVTRRFGEEPLADRQALDAALAGMIESAAIELRQTGLYARRVMLSLQCEDDSNDKNHVTDWMVPLPVQTSRDLAIVVPVLIRRLLPGVRSPVTSLSLTADHLTLPTAASGDLFAARRARHKEQIAFTRRLLAERHGPRALRRLSELPVDTRDVRRALVRQGYLQP